MNARALVNRETVSYTVFGVLTSVLNISAFELLIYTGCDYRVANLIALVITKIAAYVVNKVFVFRSRTESLGALTREFFRYTVARGGTMLIDYFGLILLVDLANVPKTPAKLAMTALVVILNYALGKWCVFKPTGPKPAQPREG
jgi:putative flippase GtrA